MHTHPSSVTEYYLLLTHLQVISHHVSTKPDLVGAVTSGAQPIPVVTWNTKERQHIYQGSHINIHNYLQLYYSYWCTVGLPVLIRADFYYKRGD